MRFLFRFVCRLQCNCSKTVKKQQNNLREIDKLHHFIKKETAATRAIEKSHDIDVVCRQIRGTLGFYTLYMVRNSLVLRRLRSPSSEESSRQQQHLKQTSHRARDASLDTKIRAAITVPCALRKTLLTTKRDVLCIRSTLKKYLTTAGIKHITNTIGIINARWAEGRSPSGRKSRVICEKACREVFLCISVFSMGSDVFFFRPQHRASTRTDTAAHTKAAIIMYM